MVQVSPKADRRRRVVHEVIELLPISAEALAKELGVTGATLSRWRSGDREMPESVVPKIAALLQRHGDRLRKIERKLNHLR